MRAFSTGRRKAAGALLAGLLAPRAVLAQFPVPPAQEPVDGGPYVPTPLLVVERMLALARVRADDLVFDLGSGDGRLVIEAARRHGARGVGVERHADLVARSREAARAAGVAERVQFVQGDIFEADLRRATVVTLYLLPAMMLRLAPKLRAELPAGARIVAHDFALEGWAQEASVQFESEEKAQNLGTGATQLFLYRMPASGSGSPGSR